MMGFLGIILILVIVAVFRLFTAVAGSRTSIPSFTDERGIAFTAFAAYVAIPASCIGSTLQRKRPVVVFPPVQLYLLCDGGRILVEQLCDGTLIRTVDDAFLDDLSIRETKVLIV